MFNSRKKCKWNLLIIYYYINNDLSESSIFDTFNRLLLVLENYYVPHFLTLNLSVAFTA